MADAATEPKKKRTPPPKGDRCLNCGLEITTNYCPDCGQHNTSHNHGLKQFLLEFLEEFIRFDSKLVRTIVPLVTKPGFLTKEWVAGKRVRYITPLKLYVTLSAICFLAISLKTQLYGANQSDLNFNVNSTDVRLDANSKQGADKSKSNDKALLNGSALDNLLRRKFTSPRQLNKREIREKFISLLPTMTFAIMPIIAGIFYLLYIRSKRYYVEHLVFTLHYYSFAFVIVTVASLIPLKLVTDLGFLWILAYLPIALVKNFGLGYFKTFVKLGIFGFLYAIVLVVAMLATLIVMAIQLPDAKPRLDTNTPTLSNNAPEK